MADIVLAHYQDLVVSFTEEAWFNATLVAEKYGKRVADWLENRETQEYMAALAEILNVPKEALLKAKRGRYGGTWMHPKLAIRFAQWLDVRFAVWCDMQIDTLLKGTHPHYDWKKLRHQATASYKVMSQILQMTRERLGKTCAPHHFSNEARMINWALAGKFCGVGRDGMSPGDLDLLAKLENLNTILIGCGASYADRKNELEQFAAAQRVGPALASAEQQERVA
jgi:hypothetical protein